MKSKILLLLPSALLAVTGIVSAVNAESITIGKLPWQGGVSAKVSQTWHSDGWGRQALDIGLGAGTTVRAPIASKVVQVCTAKGGDNHGAILLETTASKQRYSLIHVKIDTNTVKVGKTFSQGDVIGAVAKDKPNDPKCAVSYGIHLHFGLPSQNVLIDGLTFKSDSPKYGASLTSSNSR